MKFSKNTFFKTMGAIALFFALTFSPDVNAFGDRDGRSGDRDGKSGDRDGRSGDRDGKSGDRDSRSGDRDSRSGDRDSRSGDRDSRSGDRDGKSKTPSAPLGGLGILVLGAAAFGVKKLRDNSKNDKF